MKDFYLGIDLSSPSGVSAISILNCSKIVFFDFLPFHEINLFLKDLKKKYRIIVAIDGPQGLSGEKNRARIADALLRTPVRCGFSFPPPSNPYSSFVRGSVQLFYSLYEDGFKLYRNSEKNFEILETYPHSAWRILAPSTLLKKTTEEGRRERIKILENLGISVPENIDHHFLDATICSLTALFAEKRKFNKFGMDFFEDKGLLREGWIILPSL